MTQSSMHASSFYKEVAASRQVWIIKDDGGFPAPIGDGGRRAMPFWSSYSRAEKIIKNVKAYAGFEVVGLDWVVFRDRWLVGLKKDGLNVGVNWSGSSATGYDVDPQAVLENVEYQIGSST